MWTLTFWKQALERAIKTAAQVGAALLGVAGLGILDVDWRAAGSVIGLALIASFLTSLATSEVGQANSPSAVTVTAPPPPPPTSPPDDRPEHPREFD